MRKAKLSVVNSSRWGYHGKKRSFYHRIGTALFSSNPHRNQVVTTQPHSIPLKVSQCPRCILFGIFGGELVAEP